MPGRPRGAPATRRPAERPSQPVGLPREIQRRLLQDQLLLLQPRHALAQIPDLGLLLPRVALPLTGLDLRPLHPLTERLRMQTKAPRDLRDRRRPRPVQPDRFLPELRRPLRRATHPDSSHSAL